MLTDSHLQPFALLIFTLGGASSYFLYEVLRLIRLQNRLKIFVHVLDAVFVAFVGLIFIAITHLFYGGMVTYYTIFSFILGVFILRVSLKPLIRKNLVKLKEWYKIRFSTNPNKAVNETVTNNKEKNNEQSTFKTTKESTKDFKCKRTKRQRHNNK